MQSTHSTHGLFVGIDVANAELMVSILPSAERFTVANDDRC
jgi:hypothetical protein